MIVVIDNYDSFTYNLVQYVMELGQETATVRNDAVSAKDVRAMKPDKIIISPGPCTPKEAGISNEVIQSFYDSIPLLGVCLGHQCIGHVFGGKIIKAKQLMHGKTSLIYHDKDMIFADLKNPFTATRYHSLAIDRATVPDCLSVIAWTDDEEIMGVRHKRYPVWGVQFHPESILSEGGKELLRNFLNV